MQTKVSTYADMIGRAPYLVISCNTFCFNYLLGLVSCSPHLEVLLLLLSPGQLRSSFTSAGAVVSVAELEQLPLFPSR